MRQINIDYHAYFDREKIVQGMAYASKGSVLYAMDDGGNGDGAFCLFGEVQSESQEDPYFVSVSFNKSDQFNGDCDCFEGNNCKHVVALLIDWQKNNKSSSTFSYPDTPLNLNSPLDHSMNHWMSQFNQVFTAPKKKKPQEIIVYVIGRPPPQQQTWATLFVQSYTARQLLQGGLGKPHPFYPSTLERRRRISSEDLEIYGLLDLIDASSNTTRRIGNNGYYVISNGADDRFLKRLLETGRCYWQTVEGEFLHQAKPLSVQFTWQLEKNGMQHLVCLENKTQRAIDTLSLSSSWYVDTEKNQIGPLDTGLPNAVVSILLTAPNIPPAQAKQAAKQLKKIDSTVSIPVPQTFNSVKQETIAPVPKLSVYKKEMAQAIIETESDVHVLENKSLIVSDVEFTYGDATITPHDAEIGSSITYVKDGGLVQVQRDDLAEREYMAQLATRGLKVGVIPALHADDEADTTSNVSCLIGENNIEHALMFGEQIAPALAGKGWDIEFDANEFYDLLSVDAWYTDLDEESDYDWFSLDLGVMVNGEKVSLLPYLLEAIKHLKLSEGQETHYLKLPAGQVLPIPAERIERIVTILTQFVDPKRLSSEDTLRFSRYQASLLAEIEKAFERTKLRWMGGKRLKDLGDRLSKFKAIKTVKVPKRNFMATLRPYQQEGLNWMQFLREYELNGILADDMGLGKTLQTLSHIFVEKQKKRLEQPCLIVAPTSVVANWALEAKRFTPTLRVLVLRGPDRKASFDSILDYDIVLTTYPLIVRDKEVLLSHTYYMMILDEAQHIKNAKAKMTQIIQQFRAKHRLCLTGTPLENHLGELWSLFHFLMPGLLGSSQSFKKFYRNPIEKNQDKTSLKRLITTVKPFILRRTKNEVLQDLPEKTEIIQKVELGNAQRDLYESIRLAMDKKVRSAIDNKGIEHCQIIILDALLKLRQACCDPSLVKLKAAQNVKGSAKRDMLFEMLKEMVEEGRRILLFSQFTSMLSLIKADLDSQGISYVMLTGRTKNRVRPIEAFQNGEASIFLISLKAGATGINLTAADTVIHYDPWWNPAIENQATDRAHRIGQKKAVFVYKLVAENTVEEKILLMQEKKKSLITALFSGEQNKTKLNKQDLAFLFSQ